MNNIQKLISELEVEMKQANEKCDKYMQTKNDADYWMNFGIWSACFKHIGKLTLLLEDESKQPQPPISQTPMLGEVPQVGHSNISESSPAVEGATPVVGQNEQTKEFTGCAGCPYPDACRKQDICDQYLYELSR